MASKVFWGGPGVNENGLSAKHVREGVEASLARLQTDYVDLLFCHRPDPFTPTETVVRAMTDAVRSGHATAWGTSEWSAQQITEAVWMARAYGLQPPMVEQPQCVYCAARSSYAWCCGSCLFPLLLGVVCAVDMLRCDVARYHMFHRARFENEYAPLYQQVTRNTRRTHHSHARHAYHQMRCRHCGNWHAVRATVPALVPVARPHAESLLNLPGPPCTLWSAH